MSILRVAGEVAQEWLDLTLSEGLSHPVPATTVAGVLQSVQGALFWNFLGSMPSYQW